MALPVEDAFVSATKLTGFVAAAFVLLGVVFSLLLPRTKPWVQGREAEWTSAAEEAIELGAL